MRLRVHHKLFLSYSLLVAAVVVALTLGVEATLRTPLLDQAQEELYRELALGREIHDRDPDRDPDSLARHLSRLTGHRVTIIAPDGAVLGDSGVDPGQVAALENHLSRPEVQAALAAGAGGSVRHSVSVDAELLYAAVRTEQGRVIRFAVSIGEIDAAVERVRRQILQVGGVALFLAAMLSLGFSLLVTRPLRRMRDIAGAMAGGDLTARVRIERSDEFGELGRALDTLAGELRRRLGQLEGEREEMSVLIDSMAEGVLALDAEGRVRRANPAARRMFGLSEDLVGTPPEEVARHREYLSLVRRALEGEAGSPVELSHKDRHLLATAQPLPKGGAVLVVLDTSELRRLEGVRRDFVANASHELKTPLTVIRGYAETLTDDDLPDEMRREFLLSLRAHADRLQAILEDLLDLSRLESGGWQVHPEPVALDEMASQTWHPFTEAAEARGIRFGVDVEPAAQVTADEEAVRQIFSNLLSNAVRYTPDGGRIDLVARRESEGWVQVEVRDTGIGIAEPHLSRIFERFYRADPGRSREEGGTGLGLAIVRHLVERHGGRVEALSARGEGTTIRFTLPASETSLPDPEPTDR